MKEVLELMIKSLVENEDEVSVNEVEGEKAVIYEVKVAKDDMGKVIGKQGKVAKSIRTIMKALAGKKQKKVNVEFLD